MTIKLKKLLKDIPNLQIRGSKEVEITGISANSKLVAPGNLFIARKGLVVDGSIYITEAIEAGAVAIVTDLYDPLLDKNITQILHPNTSTIEGLLAASYYKFPSHDLFMVGITGTNGKTTTAFLIKHLFDKLNGLTGLIGTIEYIIGPHRYRATRTTPDVSSTQKMLREMTLQGCKNAVMEVTSHALDQNRMDHIRFDVAVFTNLTQDHLDYHLTMENYFKAKHKLFLSLDPSKTAIINIDSPWSSKFIENCPGKIFTYSLYKEANLFAREIVFLPTGTSMTLHHQNNSAQLLFPLVGRFNAYNCLAAAAVGLAKGFSLKQISEVLATVRPISGRLEPVTNSLGLKIYVDFAHTDDALLNVLQTLNEFKTGRLICIFGCGGCRDAHKRPKMAQVSEAHADIVIVTSDNPRSENPADIVSEIISGFKNPLQHFIELDRLRAIEMAIEMATLEDIILIAGKGHETYQTFAHTTIEFDDCLIAHQLCEKKAANLILSHKNS